MNRTKIFALLIGALLVSVAVRGQGNVEAIVAQNAVFRCGRLQHFTDSLGTLQFFRHYVTGTLVPDTTGKYFPAMA
jgi:hypothetical protein